MKEKFDTVVVGSGVRDTCAAAVSFSMPDYTQFEIDMQVGTVHLSF